MKGRFSALVSIDMCHENNVFIDFLDIQIKKKIKKNDKTIFFFAKSSNYYSHNETKYMKYLYEYSSAHLQEV